MTIMFMRWIGIILIFIIFFGSAAYIAYTIVQDLRSGQTTMHRSSGPNFKYSRRKDPFAFWGTILINVVGIGLLSYVGYALLRIAFS